AANQNTTRRSVPREPNPPVLGNCRMVALELPNHDCELPTRTVIVNAGEKKEGSARPVESSGTAPG
ncbi:MAG TPA: hypothetical protein VEI52_15565, partial [Terriglobales bacterium]|nr:hypothetical protein [Terriglobales bacterium]